MPSLLTKEQWQRRFERSLPGWWVTQNEEIQRAILAGAGAVFERLNFQVSEHFRMTKIGPGGAEGVYLDSHGEERNVERLPSEPDDVYRERIRNIINSSNCPALKAAVDALLINGESVFWEHNEQAAYLNSESFLNRSELFSDIKYNSFSIVVDNQIHDPYSFMDREYFLDREDAMGTGESEIALFERIIAAVNKSKAFGILYRVLERDAA